MPLLLSTLGVTPAGRCGLFGEISPSGRLIGGSSSRPVGLKCSSHGPNSSPTHRSPRRSRSKRLRIDVAAGEPALASALHHDGEADQLLRIGELDEVANRHRARATALGLEVRGDVVGADQEVLRVGLGAIAVVRHRQELAPVAAADQGGEPLDRLGRGREGDPVRLGRRHGPRRRAGSVGLDGHHRPAEEPGGVCAAVAVRLRRGGRDEHEEGGGDADAGCSDGGGHGGAPFAGRWHGQPPPVPPATACGHLVTHPCPDLGRPHVGTAVPSARDSSRRTLGTEDGMSERRERIDVTVRFAQGRTSTAGSGHV